MEDTRSRWERAFAESLDHDTWGQVEEAVEGYQRLQIAAAAEYTENVLQLPMPRRDSIGKLAAALKLRMNELHTTEKGLGLNSMKKIKPWMKEIIVTDAPFPLPNINMEAVLGVVAVSDQEMQQEHHQEEKEQPLESTESTLLGPPPHAPGDITLGIWIEKWGFKDATGFSEPRVLVSVHNGRGDLIEAVQETPASANVSHNYIFFDNTVYIQTSLNCLPRVQHSYVLLSLKSLPQGSAIFLEFRHWKASKHKKSTRAYCYIEMDEIKSGPLTLEVYKKPAEYARKKKPSLLTVKNFYLHLELSLKRH